MTKEQIQELYAFTRAHYVEHFDLQTELVDHLANGIACQWQTYPDRSFKLALDIEFKKFGVFGFMGVVEQRGKAMRRRYRAIVWRYFKEWWSMPKLMGVLSAIFILYAAGRATPEGDLKLGVVFGLFFALSSLFFYRSFQLKRRMEGLRHKWMLQEMIHEQGTLVQLVFLPLHLLNLAHGNGYGYLSHASGVLACSVLLVVMALAVKICGYTIPSQADALLSETYPEYDRTL